MRVIAVANQKGGSAKTTTVINLAAALAEKRRKVLILDLDPQAAASAWLGSTDETPGLLEALTGNGNLTPLIRNTTIPGVDLIPSSLWLVNAERALARKEGAESTLALKMRDLPGNRWDYLFIDCPPSLSLLTLNALVAASEVLIPVECHVMALVGLAQLRPAIERIREGLNPRLKICGCLATRVDWRTRHAEDVLRELREHGDSLTYKTVIRESVRLAECSSFQKPITEYDPDGRGAEDYRALAREVIRQEGR